MFRVVGSSVVRCWRVLRHSRASRGTKDSCHGTHGLGVVDSCCHCMFLILWRPEVSDTVHLLCLHMVVGAKDSRNSGDIADVTVKAVIKISGVNMEPYTIHGGSSHHNVWCEYEAVRHTRSHTGVIAY